MDIKLARRIEYRFGSGERPPPEGCRAVRGPSSKLLSDRVDKVDGPVNLGSGWLAVAEHLTLTGD